MATFVRRTPSVPPPGGVTVIVPDGTRVAEMDSGPVADSTGALMIAGGYLGPHDEHDEPPPVQDVAKPARTGQPAANGRHAAPKKDAAASTDEKKNSTPALWATATAIALFGIGLWVAVLVFGTPTKGPTYKAAAGIGAFALFYVVAQAAERFVEMTMPFLEQIPAFGKDKLVADRDRAVVTANDPDARAARALELARQHGLFLERKQRPTPTAGKKGKDEKPAKTPEEDAANKEALVEQRRADRAAIVFGATAAIGMALCGYLEADFLAAVGVTLPVQKGTPTTGSQVIAMAVTGLIVGGGSKALHDLIGNVSKASSAKDTPTETGGTK
ncbi:hypothetical protein [Nocardioides ungokensis]|uniref:hypothetical protein n=1 Tax=Nocardioides ungokensis TaxID=1643322 RepID=UPI0015DF634D|nr:hypothetical protein [Nocardioides ungokensis]